MKKNLKIFLTLLISLLVILYLKGGLASELSSDAALSGVSISSAGKASKSLQASTRPRLPHKAEILHLQKDLTFTSPFRYGLYGIAAGSVLIDFLLKVPGAYGATTAGFLFLSNLYPEAFSGNIFNITQHGVSATMLGMAGIRYGLSYIVPSGSEEEAHKGDYHFLKMLRVLTNK